ncbi:myosin-like protein [Achlya hypogyna]|uniref:Myosin-like protein n=1 Tax=Achlya hypogyna TaxID=1202772 RepID=A0A1V9Z5S9_ACHHY|nr:myosin-like protein [Achlya hypogyna]
MSTAEHTQVYVPDDKVAWIAAQVLSATDDAFTVQTQGDASEENLADHPANGATRTVPKTAVCLQNELPAEGCADMVHLNYLHEAAILYNLKTRFHHGLPYTYTGPICIAVNPYKWLDIYNTSMQSTYMDVDKLAELPPHVYAVSARSYNHMQVFGENQSILVSGESGAGKTETTKILMSHLATAGDRTDADHTMTMNIVERVLQSNPLMESFGNAKTSRNDNSSRFGKFSELQFNAECQLVGARCNTYLLEKSRVSTHGKGERNYHIFYQLLAAPETVRAQVELHETDPMAFPFLRGTAATGESVMTDLDAEYFERTLTGLTTLGIAEADQISVFGIVSAILHLGRVEFTGDEAKMVATPATVAAVTKLLGFTAADFEQSLCTRQMAAGLDSYTVPHTMEQATSARTALSVALYSRLFDWLVTHINASTSSKMHVAHRICILDIFGFEIFENNSFEQLCINYANEKLQQKFTQDVFKSIQNEYEEEGIPWTKIDFADNVNVLELIEGRFGLLALLNEECMRPKGSDSAFTNKLSAHYNDNDRFEIPRLKRNCFAITHYAGYVAYDTAGFLVKNTDALQKDVLALLYRSSAPFVNALFPAPAESKATVVTNRLRRSNSILADSVGTQFKSQLNALMEDIRRTHVQYVRCIKPNSTKSPHTFSKGRVAAQLQCAGVVEAVRISRMAFPNRLLQQECLQRFRLLVRAAACDSDDDEINQCAAMLAQLLAPADFQLGKSRVFFRAGALERLEDLRTRQRDASAIVLQRVARQWAATVHYRKARKAAILLQSYTRGYLASRRYRAMRAAAITLQCAVRCYVATQLVVAMRQTKGATLIQSVFKMHLARATYVRTRNASIKMQCLVRGFIAKKGFARLLVQAKEEAKLENQIQRLKDRLKEEKARADQLSRRASMAGSVPFESELEGASGVIDQLRTEMTLLKEANAALKVQNATLKKEKEGMERGAYVNGASFAAANQRAAKLQEEVDFLKTAHSRIKDTHKTLRLQNTATMEGMRHLQMELHNVVCERNALQQSCVALQAHLVTIESDNRELTNVNARLRLILRQDPELNRKSREEVAGLMKNVRQAQEARAAKPSPPTFASVTAASIVKPVPVVQQEVTAIMVKANSVPKKSKALSNRVINLAEPVKESDLNAVRQPTGVDGPLPSPAKVMGLIDSDDEDAKVSFRVTLVDVPEEPAAPPTTTSAPVVKRVAVPAATPFPQRQPSPANGGWKTQTSRPRTNSSQAKQQRPRTNSREKDQRQQSPPFRRGSSTSLGGAPTGNNFRRSGSSSVSSADGHAQQGQRMGRGGRRIEL